MGDLYASAIGTTVLQLKELPPRPKEPLVIRRHADAQMYKEFPTVTLTPQLPSIAESASIGVLE